MLPVQSFCHVGADLSFLEVLLIRSPSIFVICPVWVSARVNAYMIVERLQVLPIQAFIGKRCASFSQKFNNSQSRGNTLAIGASQERLSRGSQVFAENLHLENLMKTPLALDNCFSAFPAMWNSCRRWQKKHKKSLKIHILQKNRKNHYTFTNYGIFYKSTYELTKSTCRRLDWAEGFLGGHLVQGGILYWRVGALFIQSSERLYN